MYLEIFIAGLSVMLLSISAVVLVWKGFRHCVERNLRFLVTFALGVFVATLYLMLSETTHLQSNLVATTIAAALGALALEVLHRLIPEAHHHHGANEAECCAYKDNHHVPINPRRILLGDAAHNIGDGILIVTAFFVSVHAGVAVTVGVLLHELVQEISEFFILKGAGYSTRRALISNLIVSSTVFIGIGAGLIVASATAYIPLLIAFSAGGILYIIIRDLLPHTLARIKHGGRAFTHIIALMLGVGIMLMSAYIIPHRYVPGENAHTATGQS